MLNQSVYTGFLNAMFCKSVIFGLFHEQVQSNSDCRRYCYSITPISSGKSSERSGSVEECLT